MSRPESRFLIRTVLQMEKLLRRFCAAAFVVLATIAWPAAQSASAADGAPAHAPKNAFNKPERHQELSALARDNGEVRVILSLETAQELARGPYRAPDQAKEQAVSARQQRVLQRAAGHNLRNVKRFRLHHFIAVTVDAAALEALLADPEVTSVSEDRLLYPVLQDTPGITRADMAWAEGYRGAGQTVAIIDTGVDKTHPFFAGKVVAEACFSHPGRMHHLLSQRQASADRPGRRRQLPRFRLGCWHGTHVAGIAAGKYGVLSAHHRRDRAGRELDRDPGVSAQLRRRRLQHRRLTKATSCTRSSTSIRCATPTPSPRPT